MSDKIKELAPQIWEEIQKASTILIHCHPQPDGDSVGSVLATKIALESIGKKVIAIWGDSAKPNALKILPGYDDILFKNFTEIDLTDIDLFISLDSASTKMITEKGEVVFPDKVMTINIDHHESNLGYAKINLVDSSSVAVCQILFNLFKEWDIKLTQDIAICLFVGLYTDSGGFKYAVTSVETYQIATTLVETGINFASVLFEVENSMHPKSMEYLGLILSNIEHYFSGRVAICSVSLEQLKSNGIPDEIEVLNEANLIKSAIGNDISIFLKERSPSLTSANFKRRDDKFNLSKIATTLGGGGHVASAGAPINQPLQEAKKLVLKTLGEMYPELGQP